MSEKLNATIAVIGIDIGKNSFHVVGHDVRGAIVLRHSPMPVESDGIRMEGTALERYCGPSVVTISGKGGASIQPMPKQDETLAHPLLRRSCLLLKRGF